MTATWKRRRVAATAVAVVALGLAGCGAPQMGAVGGEPPAFVDASAEDFVLEEVATDRTAPQRDEGLQSVGVVTSARIGPVTEDDPPADPPPPPPRRTASGPAVDVTDPAAAVEETPVEWHERTTFLSLTPDEAVSAYSMVYEDRGLETTTQLSTTGEGAVATVFAVAEDEVVALAEISDTGRGTMVYERWSE